MPKLVPQPQPGAPKPGQLGWLAQFRVRISPFLDLLARPWVKAVLFINHMLAEAVACSIAVGIFWGADCVMAKFAKEAVKHEYLGGLTIHGVLMTGVFVAIILFIASGAVQLYKELFHQEPVH